MLSKKYSRRDMLKLTGAAAGATLMAACAAPPAPSATTSGDAEPAMGSMRKTVRWWDNYNAEHPIGSTLIDQVFPVFEKENPGWDVEFTFVTNTELVPKMITSRMAGEPADLFANFAGRGSLAHAGYTTSTPGLCERVGPVGRHDRRLP